MYLSMLLGYKNEINWERYFKYSLEGLIDSFRKGDVVKRLEKYILFLV